MSEQRTPDTTLMRELGFSPQDLEANRAGQLSEMQHYRLRLRRSRSMWTGVAVLLLAVFIASLLIFIGGNGSPILTLIGIGVTICAAAMMGMFTRYWFRLTTDIQAGTVEAYQGELERVIKPVTRRVLNYLIRVDGAEVYVSKDAFELFEHKQPYALYRTRHTGTLLAVERL
ncbi:MAG: hypothetical protein OHK0046_15450 [Anaerolineae bacterium]